VQTYYGTLRACLSDAVDNDLLGRSPCRGVKLPAKRLAEKRVISADELHRLADAVGPEWRSLVYLGGVVGLRFGEATALRVQDVDLDRCRISVTRTVVDDGGRVGIDTPKTTASLRTLAIPEPLAGELRAHIELLHLSDKAALLFADSFGGPLRRSNFRSRVFGPAVKAVGLDGLTFHGLRHSAATQWVAHGLDPRTVQHRLGHADPRLVLQLYAHAVSETDARAAEETAPIYWSDGPKSRSDV
jgi:integrase